MKGLELFNLCFSSRAVVGFAAVDSGRSRRRQVKQPMNRDLSRGQHPQPQLPLQNLAPARCRQEDLALPGSCGQSGHAISSPGIGVSGITLAAPVQHGWMLHHPS